MELSPRMESGKLVRTPITRIKIQGVNQSTRFEICDRYITLGAKNNCFVDSVPALGPDHPGMALRYSVAVLLIQLNKHQKSK